MTATATATDTATPRLKAVAVFENITLDRIAPSGTPMQKLRRQHFDKAALQELADSIKALGVLQPVLVRPDSQFGKSGYYELVAGERRYLAAKLAGLAAIPATIRTLTDLEVIEMQVVENNQREGLHELIEAEGFEQLRKPPHNLKAEDIADKVGKSRRYVFNRLKLCDLCPEARTAFYDDKISGTVAFQIARIGNHDTQRTCLRELLHAAPGDKPSKRYAEDLIRRKYMLMLDGKSFPIGDATLCPKAGACGPCPKRTGNQAELFDDMKVSANVCTDPKCFGDKVAAFSQRRRDEAVKAGRTVITGKLAKEMMPYQHSHSIKGAVKPDDTCWDDPQRRSYQKLLGKDAPPTALLENPHSRELVEVWPESQIKKVLQDKLPKKKTVKRSAGAMSAGSKDDAKELEVINDRIEAELFRQIHAKHSGKLGPIELRAIAKLEIENLATINPLTAYLKLPDSYSRQGAAIDKIPEKELPRVIACALALDGIFGDRVTGIADALCKQLKIDVKKIAKDVKEAVKKEKADKAKAAPAKASAAKKKTVAKK